MAVQNQLNGAQKRITQSGFKIEQGFGLGTQNAARQRQQATLRIRQRAPERDRQRAFRDAPRAVGQACGANPFPLIVPCHRVIAAGGGLGGFSRQRGGFLLDIKRWLLAHEGR